MFIVAEGCRLLRDERSGGDSYGRKAAVRKVEVTRSAPTSKREMGLKGALCLLYRLPFDLEGLVTATRQEAYRSPRGKRATWSGNQLPSTSLIHHRIRLILFQHVSGKTDREKDK